MPPEAVRAPAAQRQRLTKILAAGTRLFDRHGFARTTMDDIADAAGITKRTLYRYVSSKPAFLQMIHEQFLDAAEAQIPQDLGSPRTELEAFVRGYAEVIVKHQRAVRVFFEEEYHLGEDARAEVVRRRDEFERRLRSLLDRGREAGEFREVDVAVVAAGLFGALASTYRWYRPSGSLATSDLVELVTGVLLHGVAARPDAIVDVVSPPAPAPIVADGVPGPIVEAAVELFATRGFAETSTQDVARAAGVTKSALFYHIGSKEDLLELILRTFAERTVADLRVWTAVGDTPLAKVQSVIVHHAVIMGSLRPWVRVFLDQDRYLSDDGRRAVEDLRARYVDGLTELVADGVATGGLRRVEPRVVALVTVGMLNWMSRWFDPYGRLDAEAVGREFAALVTSGVCGPQLTS